LQRTGIGPALKQARLLQGKSIEEASRETHIRPEYLDALEDERYDTLIGDPYVRGFLRSYSTYLGLDPDKVVIYYNRSFGEPRPSLPEPAPGPARSRRATPPHLVDVVRHHPSWAFLVGVAILALVVAGAAGLLSRSPAVPEADEPAVRSSVPVLPPSVVVTLTAEREVEASVLVDGKDRLPAGIIRRDQALSFEGTSRIRISLSEGGVVTITVNGRSLGTPGERGAPYSRSFGPQDYRGSPSETTPSP
jgi:cytoskeletal protein RodZ